MDTNARHVVNPLIQYAPPPEGGEFFNIGRPVRCCNPFWVGMTRGNVATTSWAAIWPAGNNEPKSPTVLCRLYPPRIRFSKRTLALTAKDGRRIVEPWIQDAPPPDGNVWVQRIWQAQKVLLQGLIRWGGWWQTYGRSAKGGKIQRTRTDSVPDCALSTSGKICTGMITVGTKT